MKRKYEIQGKLMAKIHQIRTSEDRQSEEAAIEGLYRFLRGR